MPNWDSIVLHHSDAEDDGIRNDWAGTTLFHMSWRYKGEIITKEQADVLIAEGRKPEPPWRDNGYNFGFEMENNKLTLKVGRSLDWVGAHCLGMNDRSIGICCLGDFDTHAPSELLYSNVAMLCACLIKTYPAITPWRIFPHRKFAQKTCPGLKYDVGYVIQLTKVILSYENNWKGEVDADIKQMVERINVDLPS